MVARVTVAQINCQPSSGTLRCVSGARVCVSFLHSEVFHYCSGIRGRVGKLRVRGDARTQRLGDQLTLTLNPNPKS